MFGQNKDLMFGQNKHLIFGQNNDLKFGQRAVNFSPVSSIHCRLKFNLASWLFRIFDYRDDWDDWNEVDRKDTYTDQ